MPQKDDIEVRKTALLKAARSLVRLRHSLAADAELNEVLPRVAREFDRSVQDGTLPQVAQLLAEFIADSATDE